MVGVFLLNNVFVIYTLSRTTPNFKHFFSLSENKKICLKKVKNIYNTVLFVCWLTKLHFHYKMSISQNKIIDFGCFFTVSNCLNLTFSVLNLWQVICWYFCIFTRNFVIIFQKLSHLYKLDLVHASR